MIKITPSNNYIRESYILTKDSKSSSIKISYNRNNLVSLSANFSLRECETFVFYIIRSYPTFKNSCYILSLRFLFVTCYLICL